MAGASRHIPMPADDPGFLEDLAELLERHPSHPDPRYAERCRIAAAKLRESPLPKLTAASPLDDLIPHGVSSAVVKRLKEGAKPPISTVGELCEHNATWLCQTVRQFGMGAVADLSNVLARFYMGLRPR